MVTSRRLLALVASAMVVSAPGYSAQWDAEPSIRTRLVLTDNIDRSEDKDSDLVTEISPGISLNADGNRLDLDLDYRLQTLTHVENSNRNRLNHQLRAGANSELIADHFFLDVSGSVSQQLQDRRASASSDGVSGSANLSDVTQYSVNPRWEQRLGDWAEVEVGYGYDSVDSEGRGSSGSTDSESNRFNAQLNQASDTQKLFYSLDYSRDDTEFGDNSFNDQRTFNGQIGYRLSRRWSAFIRGSDSKTDFDGTRGAARPDDKQYGAGLTWTPNQRLSLTVAANKRDDASPGQQDDFRTANLTWQPTVRTTIEFDYGNQFFGETYAFELIHSTRRTQWFVSYDEGESDFQRAFLDALRFGVFCLTLPDGTPIISANTCAAGSDDLIAPDGFARVGSTELPFGVLGDDTFISKTLRAGFTISGARNTIDASITNLRREFVADNDNERDFIIRASWSYQLAPHTTATLEISRTNRGFDNGDEDRLNELELRFEKSISQDASLSLAFSHDERRGDGNGRGFKENRITFGFTKTF